MSTDAANAILNTTPVLVSTGVAMYATRSIREGVPRRQAYAKAMKYEREGRLDRQGFVIKRKRSSSSSFKRSRRRM